MTKRCFSLLEVIVAVGLLALTLVAVIAIVGNAQHDLLRARQQWAEKHGLDLATEYFLMAGPKQLALPGDLLDDGYRAACSVERVAPAGGSGSASGTEVQPYQGWVLVAYRIVLSARDGTPVATREVHKLVPETDL